MALSIDSALSEIAETQTFSFHMPDDSASDAVSPAGDMGLGTSQDILVYHASYGDPTLTQLVMMRPEKLVVVYHNITPSGYFANINVPFALGLQWGRHELRLLASRAELAIADSEYNARELFELGYEKVVVDAVGVDPNRLSDEGLDVELIRKLDDWSPGGYVLFVSQLLPHKRPDLAVSAVHLLRTIHRIDVGLVIVGANRFDDYAKSVSMFVDSLPDMKVLQLGSVNEEQLATLYRTCACYLNTSDHEGFAVPPLEAMSCAAPVVVRDCGAMGDTVSTGGLVLDADAGPGEVADAVALVISNADAAAALRRAGARRVKEFSAEVSSRRFANLIRQLV